MKSNEGRLASGGENIHGGSANSMAAKMAWRITAARRRRKYENAKKKKSAAIKRARKS